MEGGVTRGPDGPKVLTQSFLPLSVALLAHAPGLWNDFTLDDASILRESSAVRRLGGLWRLLTLPRDLPLGDPGAHPVYRPVSAALDWFSWQLARSHHLTQHAVGIVAHAIVTLLLVRLLEGMGVARRASIAAACLFAVHPATVDTVGSISARPLVVGTVGLLAGIVALQGSGRLRAATVGFLATVLAMGCHEAFVVAPLLFAAARLAAADREKPMRSFAATLGATAAAAMFVAHPMWKIPSVPVAGLLRTASGLATRFVLDSVLPINLSPFVTLPQVGVWPVLVVTCLGALWIGWRGWKPPHLEATRFGILLAGATAYLFAPAALRSTGSDRGAYLFLLGVVVALAPLLAKVLSDAVHPWVLFLPLAASVALMPLTWAHHADYRNDRTLLRSIAQSGANGAGVEEGQLASAMLAFEDGDLDQAAPCVPYVVSHPEALRAYLCAGTAILGSGNGPTALTFLRPYASRFPFHEPARRALFLGLLAAGEVDNAETQLRQWEARYQSAPDLVEARAELRRRGLP